MKHKNVDRRLLNVLLKMVKEKQLGYDELQELALENYRNYSVNLINDMKFEEIGCTILEVQRLSGFLPKDKDNERLHNTN